MVLDTSALAAILFSEPDAGFFEGVLSDASPLRISAATLVEISMVVESKLGDAGSRELDLLLYKTGVEVAPVSAEQAEIARGAFRRFGKGRHPAGLNFGDCFSYALAKSTGEPLLCKGADFPKTDIEAVRLEPEPPSRPAGDDPESTVN
jgi:ribonuclease VapC